MKTKICLLSLLVGISFSAPAGIYQLGTLAGGSAIGTISDNNTLGLGSSYTVGGENASLSALTLTFALQGGEATDLSAYLRLGNLTTSPAYDLTTLMHSQTLSAGAPTSYSVSFSDSGFQSTFNAQNPNNTWTLFFADTVAGDTTTLNGWSLDITAVPEPAATALAGFGVVLLAVEIGRRWRRAQGSPGVC